MTELLYGRNAVLEAIRAGRRSIGRVLVADGVKEGESVAAIMSAVKQQNLTLVRGSRGDLDKRTEGANHQGVALECSDYPYADLDEVLAKAKHAGDDPLLLVLDHLQDPQNIGTLLRTAEVVGVHGVVIPDRRAAGITPSVVNASAGAVEHLPVVQVANIAHTLELLKQQQIWVAGLEDDKRAQDYDVANLRGALALVVGAEGPGLARLTRERCDFLVRLPMRGTIASLNAATAGSIVLYHAWRSRR